MQQYSGYKAESSITDHYWCPDYPIYPYTFPIYQYKLWMSCPKCGRLIEGGDTYCRHCGEKLTPKYCPHCGKKLD